MNLIFVLVSVSVANTEEWMSFVHLGFLNTVSVVAGSNDPEPAPLCILLQLPTEEPARVQAGGAPLPQNGVRDSPHVQRGHLQ